MRPKLRVVARTGRSVISGAETLATFVVKRLAWSQRLLLLLDLRYGVGSNRLYLSRTLQCGSARSLAWILMANDSGHPRPQFTPLPRDLGLPLLVRLPLYQFLTTLGYTAEAPPSLPSVKHKARKDASRLRGLCEASEAVCSEESAAQHKFGPLPFWMLNRRKMPRSLKRRWS